MFAEDKKFIYDLIMAKFFEDKGAVVLFRSTHKKTHKDYIVFKYDQEMKQIYDQWNLHCKTLAKY